MLIRRQADRSGSNVSAPGDDRPCAATRPDPQGGAEHLLRGADTEAFSFERRHCTLVVPGLRDLPERVDGGSPAKGGKVVTTPLAPRTAQAIDLAISEHTEGPVILWLPALARYLGVICRHAGFE